MASFRWPLFALVVLVIVVSTQGFPVVRAQSRMLYGFVYSASTGKPIAANVTVSQCFNQQTTRTASDGSWEISFPYGTWGTVAFSAPGYATETFQLDLNTQWYYAGGIVSLQP
jgi:hypothetical protein